MRPREATRLFRAAGVTLFAGAVWGRLNVVLVGEHRRPVFPTFARSALQMLSGRAAVKQGLQMLVYLCEVTQFSSMAQWI